MDNEQQWRQRKTLGAGVAIAIGLASLGVAVVLFAASLRARVASASTPLGITRSQAEGTLSAPARSATATAWCEGGEPVLGGGADASGYIIVMSSSFPVTGSDGREGWTVEMAPNVVGGFGSFSVYAICATS